MIVDSAVEDDVGTPRAGEPVTAVATLLLGVERDGRPLLGNVVIVVEHLDGGGSRRGLRFHRNKRRYVYRDLVLGAHEIRVTVPRYEPLVQRIELTHPGEHEIVLEPVPLRARTSLLIDVSSEMESMAELVFELSQDPAALASFASSPDTPIGPAGAEIGLTARVHAALLADGPLAASLLAPADELDAPPDLRAWIDERLRAVWDFSTTTSKREALLVSVGNARLRFYLIVRAVFTNPFVASLQPELSAQALDRHLVRLLASLDTPNLDRILPFLARTLVPEIAAVDHLARALLARATDVRVPDALATRSSEAAPAAEVAFPLDGTDADHSLALLGRESTARVDLAATIGQVADVLGRALEYTQGSSSATAATS